jgi:hypothetical protein
MHCERGVKHTDTLQTCVPLWGFGFGKKTSYFCQDGPLDGIFGNFL